MNNFFFKIEYKIKLTDILNILKVPRIDFLNVKVLPKKKNCKYLKFVVGKMKQNVIIK